MKRRITNREFQEWFIYSHHQPFGERAEYYRTGILCALIANIHRDPKKKRDPFVPEDFIPLLEAQESKAINEAEKIAKAMEGFAAANPGAIRVKPKKKPRG